MSCAASRELGLFPAFWGLEMSSASLRSIWPTYNIYHRVHQCGLGQVVGLFDFQFSHVTKDLWAIKSFSFTKAWNGP